MSQINDFLKINLIKLIYTGVVILISLLLIFIFRYLVSKFIKGKKQHNKRAVTMAKLLNSITQYTIFILGLLAILAVWGIDIKPFLAGAGLIGLAIGFGAQDLVKDIVNGFFIIIDSYYDVDDVIEIRGFKGRVVEIGLKSTRVLNWKGELKIFANRDINEVINFSKNFSTAVVNFKIRYSEDLEKVYKLVNESIINLHVDFPQIITTPQILGVTVLDESAVGVRVTVRTKAEEHYAVERGINKRLKEMFLKNNIEIAYNQIIVKSEEGKK